MYKKKDGTITVTDDQKLVTWTPAAAPGGPPVVSLAIANITSMLLLSLTLPLPPCTTVAGHLLGYSFLADQLR